MGAIGGEELTKWEKMQGDVRSRDGEEKILVLVRLKPLSEKEVAKNEVADWECINENTILFRNSLQERSRFWTAFIFDRVFGGDKPGTFMRKEQRKLLFQWSMALIESIIFMLLLSASIFAYGQTSSGKTYTMVGTEYTVANIYDYIHWHEERAIVLKFCAIVIYNEAIRDLLGANNTPLRVLDDPEKGAVMEKIMKETLRDWAHLKELLSICEG